MMLYPPLIRLIHSIFGWSETNINSWDGADRWRTISPFQVWSKAPSCIYVALGKYISHTCITGSETNHQEGFAGFSCLLKDTSDGPGVGDSRILQPKTTNWATSSEGGLPDVDWQLHSVLVCLYVRLILLISFQFSTDMCRDGWPARVGFFSPPCCEVWHLLTVTIKQEEENQHFQMCPNKRWKSVVAGSNLTQWTCVVPTGMEATDLRSERQ